jgi:hypothetical protein
MGRFAWGTLGVALWLCGGCSVHYFDPQTRTEHVWGFGHMRMRVAPPAEGLQAVVRGTDVAGLSVGCAEKQTYLTAGWHRLRTVDIVADSASVRLEWPKGDLADLRVGSALPELAQAAGAPRSERPARESAPAEKETSP